MRLRWVTWWPAPYWRDRFNELSKRVDLDLEVVFLAAHARIQGWKQDPERWAFRYRVINKQGENSGYFGVRWRLPNPWAIVRGSFDVLVMPYADMRCMAAALWCWMTARPYVLFVANTPYDRRAVRKIKEWSKGVLFRNAAGLFATGSEQRRYVLGYGVPSEKIFVIGNPSTTEHVCGVFSPAQKWELRSARGWDDEVVISYVGRFSAEKGLETLMRAVAMLHDFDIRLLLIGAGSQETTLRELARDLEIKTSFTGFVHGSDLAMSYAVSDIFVLPSHSEPWGLVVNEAMEHGLPVVLSDRVGSAPMLLETGVNGWTFPAGDAIALAEHLRKLVASKELRTRMGEASRCLIRNHSVPAWADVVCESVSRISRQSTRPNGFD